MEKNEELIRKKRKKVIVILLAFFLSLFTFFGGILAVIQSTFLSPNYMRKQLKNSDYYENVIEDAENEFTSYASASGFDQSFFKGILDINDVQLNVNQSLSVLYGESDQSVNTSDFKSKLYGKLTENVEGRKITVTDSIKNSLTLLAQTCADTYTQYISIPYYTELSQIVKKVKTPILIFESVILLIIVLLVVTIFKLSKWKHRAVRAYIYSISGTALMLTILPLIIIISGVTSRIALISKSMYAFAICYINGILYSCLYGAAFFFAVDLVLAVTYYYLKNKAIHYCPPGEN